ncbi:chemotaxis protein histidine kinase-like protein [Synechococcus sp. PCC 7502]|uniref:hybrid sensor histidine kinase/response regulator n=1 Tax=Synechococcus sp. PCC 7502 TaxID=1173263 RepID=UPI00029F94AD|nr:hybrid sensor histidine kinase/response regulator [Synechococcus sp. PCC 7502]AFY73867.1 chemotaxis protein histidine kinase-like protein [Synechococcus sp. PCC 7502]
MNTEQQQQRIMGYFIEEAKDHLNTIEQGVLNLQDVLLDTEMTNEMFRAAHSIKGGAAMLGVVSVQHISHRLEDYFKILQEHNNIQVDERLKSLFLAGFDRLQELIEQLETNYKISDELASSALESVKPIFIELESYLNRLVEGDAADSSDNLVSTFQSQVANKLRDMLQLFKQDDTAGSRRELENICSDLLTIGNNLNLHNWSQLILTSKAAIAFEDNSYRVLAPVIIKDTKYAQDLVLQGKDSDITISPELQALIPTTAPIASFNDDDDITVFMDNISDFDSSDVSMDDLFSDAGLEYSNESNSDFDDLSDLFESVSAIADEETGDLSITETETINSPESSADFNFETFNLSSDIPQDAGFEDLGLEDLLQDTITDTAEVSLPEQDISTGFSDDDLGLEDFFSATDENNLESLQSIDAGAWSGDITESSEPIDDFINEFSMVTEATEAGDNEIVTDQASELNLDNLVSDDSIEEPEESVDFGEFELTAEEPSITSAEFSNDSIEEPEESVDFNEFELTIEEPSITSAEFSDDSIEEPEESVDFNEFELTTEEPSITSAEVSNDGIEEPEESVDFNEFELTIEQPSITSAEVSNDSIEEPEESVDFNEFELTIEEPSITSAEFSDDSIEEPEESVDFNEFELTTEEPSITSAEFSNVDLAEPTTEITSTSELDELEIISAEPIQESVSESSPISFDELETLIETPPPVPVKKAANDDFDDLEALLRDSGEAGGIGVKVSKRPVAAKRQTSKIISQTMKVDVKHLDSLNNLVGELVVNRNLLDQDQEKMQQFLANLLTQVQLLSDASQKMRDQYDRSLLESSLVATREQSRVSTALMQSRLDSDSRSRSTSTDFDSIELDRFSDFHALSQEIIELIVRVRESASDIEFVVGETEQVTRQLGVITNQVQDDLKQSRMVPFAQIADRLPRAVRDLAIKTGKEADIDIRGRETLIDKAILEQLYDPMTHLVSNAIVHGLEDVNTRLSAGKSAKGMITVRAYHQGNQTIISVSDDGAGIDIERVKRSAVAKGVRTEEEVNHLTDDEVFELLFEAGFSTKSQADEFAGRGVGLDVVNSALNDIRGSIFTESILGQGTTFTIRLPLTLSISKAMLCVSNRTRIAFPVDGFEDMVEVPQNQIFTNPQGQSCLTWRNTTLPFQPLSDLLTYTRQVSRSSIYNKLEDDVISIIVLRNDTGYLALQVDQFLGEGEIVIKQLEGPIPKPVGIAGATILGDGRVMAIANVLELFDIASGRLKPSYAAPEAPVPDADETTDPTVLIVDDSITVRELLSLTFSKVGYRVEQAKDGKDAWEKLRAGMQCNLIFCDIEMPRMDGLELLSRLQKDEFLSKIPVAMLTSRGTDRHRNAAKELGAKGYFTKPYLEEEVITASKRLLKGEALV